MSGILIAVIAIAVLAAIFGLVLGFALFVSKSKPIQSSSKSKAFCHKPNAVNVAILAAVPTRKPLQTVMILINALLVASKQ